MSVTAQTFTSTRPAARPISRTIFSVRSVGTPELFFGQLIQSIPAGASCLAIGLNSLARDALDLVNTMAKSIADLPSASWQFSKYGFSSWTTSGGESTRETRRPSFMPSFFGRGVPEYPGMVAFGALKTLTTKVTKWRENRFYSVHLRVLWGLGILLRGSVPSAARAHAEILAIICQDFDRAVVAVVLQVGRAIGDGVLAAQFVLNFGEGVGDIANLERVKRASTGGVGDAVENFVAFSSGAADVGADRIDDGLGALRHFDGLFTGDVALVVFTIAEQNDGAANESALRRLQQLVSTSKVQRVVKGGAAAGAQFVNTVSQQFSVVGEILRHLGSDIEADDESSVFARVDRLVEKLDGGFLLELEAVAHRVAGVDQQADLKRKIGFRGEAADFLGRFAVVENLEVVLLEIGDAATAFVGDGEDDVDFVRIDDDLGDRVVAGRVRVGGFGILCRGRAGGSGWSFGGSLLRRLRGGAASKP